MATPLGLQSSGSHIQHVGEKEEREPREKDEWQVRKQWKEKLTASYKCARTAKSVHILSARHGDRQSPEGATSLSQ